MKWAWLSTNGLLTDNWDCSPLTARTIPPHWSEPLVDTKDLLAAGIERWITELDYALVQGVIGRPTRYDSLH